MPFEPDDQGRLRCQKLGRFIAVEEQVLRLIFAQAGERILTRQEQEKQARQRAEVAERRAQQLVAELARLKAQLGQ